MNLIDAVIHLRLLRRDVLEEVGWCCGCSERWALGRGMKKMDVDHTVMDGVVYLVLRVCGMRMDVVRKGFGQNEFEIDPRIRFGFGFGLGSNYRLLLDIDH